MLPLLSGVWARASSLSVPLLSGVWARALSLSMSGAGVGDSDLRRRE
jgi:hypothetical protein